MSTDSAVSLPRPPLPPHAVIRLRNWPLAEDGARGVLLLVAVGAMALIARQATHSRAAATLALLAMLAALWKFWTPEEVELSARGVSIRRLGITRRYRWSDFRGFHLALSGVVLWPARSDDVDAGCYLRWGSSRDPVIELVSRQLPQLDAASPELAESVPATTDGASPPCGNASERHVQ